MNYEFHPAAEAEHLDTILYYENQQAGLATAYLSEFENATKKVCIAPKRYPIVQSPRIRRIRLERFPFSILYREKENKIQVIAYIFHLEFKIEI